jgi:intracellular sulfur oxidation DsrE/DsrF family protein
MLPTPNSEYAARCEAAADSGVVLAACPNTMRQMKVTGDEHFPAATNQGAEFVYIKWRGVRCLSVSGGLSGKNDY